MDQSEKMMEGSRDGQPMVEWVPTLIPCRVCGEKDRPTGFHYGVNTCEPCKGFFHRSLKRHTEYKCRANRTSGLCPYLPGRRLSCQYCRFQRCLMNGMSKEGKGIKTGRYTYQKRLSDSREVQQLMTQLRKMSTRPQTPLGTDFETSATRDDVVSRYESIPNCRYVLSDRLHHGNQPMMLLQTLASPSTLNDTTSQSTTADMDNYYRNIVGHHSITNRQHNQAQCEEPVPCSRMFLKSVPPSVPKLAYKKNTKSPDAHVQRIVTQTSYCLDESLESDEISAQTSDNVISNTCMKASSTPKEDPTFNSLNCCPTHEKFFDSNRTKEITPSPINPSLSPSIFLHSEITLPRLEVSSDHHTRSTRGGAEIPQNDKRYSPLPIHCASEEAQLEALDLSLDHHEFKTLSQNVSPIVSEDFYEGVATKETPKNITDLPVNEDSSAKENDCHTELSSPLTPCQSLLTEDTVESMSPLCRTPVPMDKLQTLNEDTVDVLYADTQAVVQLLVGAFDSTLKPVFELPAEELHTLQKTHTESCELRTKQFGPMKFLPHQQYDEIYQMTGIDVDGRRRLVHQYLEHMDHCMRAMVKFAKAVPGFSALDIETQANLVKLARLEINVFCSSMSAPKSPNPIIWMAGWWACQVEVDQWLNSSPSGFFKLCQRIKKFDPPREELVLLSAMSVVTSDRDLTINSPLADAIHRQLCRVLRHVISQRHDQPGLVFARYIQILTESREVAENINDLLRSIKMYLHRSIHHNPLLKEVYSNVLPDQ